MQRNKPVIVWFRQDLRLADNPALAAAAGTGAPILPVYILDDENAGDWAIGGASRWWLQQSLTALNQSLGGQLRFFRGKADVILPQIAAKLDVPKLFWNRCYEPWRVARDRDIMKKLRADNRSVSSLDGSLLFPPQSITKPDGTPYRVFTPFYKKACSSPASTPREPLPQPKRLRFAGNDAGSTLASLQLMPQVPWYRQMAETWSPGESGATERLQTFLDHGIQDYITGRNRPDRNSVSRLSPHLHFGEISPQQILQAIRSSAAAVAHPDSAEHFRRELAWREFSHHLLYHWPDLPQNNLQRKFDRFPWREDRESLTRWQRGETGYPIVDAGMRQLWQTGYMHNRVRMIVASFLVKNLLIHWRAGQDWFWDTLVDADLANNSASWQWVAGSGADAAPYFRIFNPVTQGRKFDPDGAYVRRFIPELANLPARFVHCPVEAPPAILQEAGITLGETYPAPMVDLKSSRERALAAFYGSRANDASR